MLMREAFTLVVTLVAIQRLAELGLSRSNEARLLGRGAIAYAPWQVTLLAALHGMWLTGMVIEVWVLQPPFRAWLAMPAMITFLGGQALRLAAIRTLGERWTVGVLTLPATDRVRLGPYARIPHPNYLGVALEIAALPLVHGAFVTALVFTVLNAIAMATRIAVESRALAEAEP
jgi:methyltransferase